MRRPGEVPGADPAAAMLRADSVRVPADERDRLDSLVSYGVLDTPRETTYDALTALAARLSDSPMAAVTLIDDDRQWFKSTYGLDIEESPRRTSFCSDVVAGGRTLAVSDVSTTDRYRWNPFVTGAPDIRAYLGVPLIGRDGLPLGALCVLDRRTRSFSPEQVDMLTTLADQVVFLLEQRRRDLADGLLGARVVPDARDPVRLRAALRSGEITPHFQPLVDIRTGRAHQIEALLRWEHPTSGLLTPDTFLPGLEAGALVVPMGRAVLDAALGRLVQLHGQGIDLPGGVAVNVASGQLTRPGLAREVVEALSRHDVLGARLTLEITESTALLDVTVARAELDALVAMGVHVVIDDFGVGWSNLTRVLQLPVDGIKIDRSIAAHVLDDPRAAIMVASTVDLARRLGLQVTAEGIETTAVRDHLAAAGVRHGQGWLYGRAVRGHDLADALTDLGALAGGDPTGG
ncbi:EAL domain-containing protein [Nakamurella flavida]|uniref:EAL domain-containing protein n=1 Tax=Nakamurella flavida TaxID=363630 RepID=A0A939C4D0_9ACTN|nr:EAL domain-containing protein [Nakamurella flavida]MBM9475574.1 EAL domain-containing protein [Nakamurella flavida]MDP9778150.1 EAL domain-containing protein (putative c-di-GMP-specific phosphodiesterase class I) [Nakamurella flavida]